MLQALGAQFTDVDGEPIPAPICAESLSRIFSIDFSGMPRADLARRIRILADVDLPLIPYGQNDTGLSSLSFAPPERGSGFRHRHPRQRPVKLYRRR